jgi:predicted N-acetyltransferase YhbS
MVPASGERGIQLTEVGAFDIHVRPATRADAPGIVWVSNSSILPGEDVGFGGGIDSPFHDASVLAALWRDPNVVQGEEVLVAEMDGRIVGCVTVEDRGGELELVNIGVPLQLQGRGIGTILVRSVGGASQSRRKAGSYCWHEPERRGRGLEVTAVVATPRVPRHRRRGKRMDPVNRTGVPRDTTAERTLDRMRSSRVSTLPDVDAGRL